MQLLTIDTHAHLTLIVMIWKGKITGQGPFWKRWIGYNLVNFRTRKSRKDDWLAIIWLKFRLRKSRKDYWLALIWLTSVREYFTRFSRRVAIHNRWKLYYFGLCTARTALITARGGGSSSYHVYWFPPKKIGGAI